MNASTARTIDPGLEREEDSGRADPLDVPEQDGDDLGRVPVVQAEEHQAEAEHERENGPDLDIARRGPSPEQRHPRSRLPS